MRWIRLHRASVFTLTCLLLSLRLGWVRCAEDEDGEETDLVKAPPVDCLLELSPVYRKVALLFMTDGDMPHEKTWAMWLDGLTNMSAAALWCNPNAQECLKKAQRPGKSVYDFNYFFTMYVYQTGEQVEFPEGNIFHQRVVQPEGSGKGRLDAIRALLGAALEDPYNQRFQLLCGSSVPIRSPLFVYTQLLAGGSRGFPRRGKAQLRRDAVRVWADIEAMQMDEVSEAWSMVEPHLRLHERWWALSREHAEVAHEDVRLSAVFGAHCGTEPWHDVVERTASRGLACVEDRHYVGTLLGLASVGRGGYGDAASVVTDLDADAQANIGPELLLDLRMLHKCRPSERPQLPVIDMLLEHQCYMETLEEEFLKLEEAWHGVAVSDIFFETGGTVYRGCRLFARGVPAGSAAAMRTALENLNLV